MTMESIEKLRAFIDDQFVTGKNGWACGMAIADEIEREITERYMERPCDMDGRTLFFGDEIEYTGPITKCEFDRRITVRRFTIHEDSSCSRIGDYHTSFVPSECRYVKPRTIEDVLDEFLRVSADVCTEGMDKLSETIAKYADELRSMGVGE